MAAAENFFSDGEAYEISMGRWSRVAGKEFLDWLSLPSGLRWLDVGCGTGAFTELVRDLGAPSGVSGVDPSEDRIAFARGRPLTSCVDYHLGDALSLPFGDEEFDVAVMALVIGQLRDRFKAIAEMKRVVRRGGTLATYVWDGPDSGHPQQPLFDALKAMGGELRRGPGNEARSVEELRNLLDGSGLEGVTSRSIDIQLTFESFDQFWAAQTALTSRTLRAIRSLSEADLSQFKALLKESLPTKANGYISYPARANAIKGQAPK